VADRRFVIEIIGDTEQAVQSTKNLNQGLASVDEQAKKSSSSISKGMTEATGATKKVGEAGRMSGVEFAAGAAVIVGAALAVREMLRRTVFAAGDLQVAILAMDDVIVRAAGDIDFIRDSLLATNRPIEQMIGAISELAKLGAVGTEQMMQLSEVMFQFGQVTGVAANVAARQLVDFARIMNVPTERIERLAAAVATLTEDFGISVGEIKRAVFVLGPLRTMAGLSEGEVLGLAAGISQLGVVGRRALPIVIKLFGDLIERPGKLRSALGISTKAFKELIADRPSEAILSLLDKLKSLEGSQKKQIFFMRKLGIKSVQQQARFIALTDASERIRDATDLASKGFQDATFLQLEFSEVVGSLNFQLERLGEVFKNLFLRVGTILIPVMTIVVKIFRFFARLVEMIPGPILAVVVGVGFLAAGLILMTAGLIGAIRAAGFLMGQMNGLLAFGLAPATAGLKAQTLATFQLAKAKLVAIKQTFLSTVAKIKEFVITKVLTGAIFKETAALIANTVRKVANRVAIWLTVGARKAAATITALNTFFTSAETKATVINTAAKLKNAAASALQSIKAKGLLGSIKSIIPGMGAAGVAGAGASGGVAATGAAASGATPAIAGAAGATGGLGAAMTSLGAALATPLGIFIAVVAVIIAALIIVPKLIKGFDRAKGAMKGFFAVLLVMFAGLVLVFLNIKVIISILKGVFSAFFEVISDLVSTVMAPFQSLLAGITGESAKNVSIMKTLNKVFSIITAVWKFMIKTALIPLRIAIFKLKILLFPFVLLGRVLAGVWQALRSAFAAVIEPIQSIIDTVKSAFKPILDLFSGGGKAGEGFMSAITTVAKVLFTVFFPFLRILQAVGFVLKVIGFFIAGVFNAIKAAFEPVVEAFGTLKDVVTGIFDSLKGSGGGFIDFLKGIGSLIINIFVRPFKIVFGVVAAIFQVIGFFIGGIFDGIKAAFAPVAEAFSTLKDLVTGIFGSLEGSGGGFIDFLKGIGSFIISNFVRPFKIVFTVISTIFGVIGAVIGGVFKGIMGVITPVKEAFSAIFDAIKAAFAPIIELFSSGTEEGVGLADVFKFITGAVSFLIQKAFLPLILWAKVVAFVMGGVAKLFGLLWEGIKFGVKVVLAPLRLLLIPFILMGKILSFLKELIFGSGLLGIDTAINIVLAPLRALMGMFEIFGKIVGIVADAFKMLFSIVLLPLKIIAGLIEFIFGGGGGASAAFSVSIGVAFGNFITAISGFGDAIVNAAVTGAGSSSVTGGKMSTRIEAAFGNTMAMFGAAGASIRGAMSIGSGSASIRMPGGGGGGFDEPIKVKPIPADRSAAAVIKPQSRAAFPVPKIVIPITLTLDGAILAQITQEHQAVEMMRFFNDPRLAMRGICTE